MGAWKEARPRWAEVSTHDEDCERYREKNRLIVYTVA